MGSSSTKEEKQPPQGQRILLESVAQSNDIASLKAISKTSQVVPDSSHVIRRERQNEIKFKKAREMHQMEKQNQCDIQEITEGKAHQGFIERKPRKVERNQRHEKSQAFFGAADFKTLQCINMSEKQNQSEARAKKFRVSKLL